MNKYRNNKYNNIIDEQNYNKKRTIGTTFLKKLYSQRNKK